MRHVDRSRENRNDQGRSAGLHRMLLGPLPAVTSSASNHEFPNVPPGGWFVGEKKKRVPLRYLT